MSAASNTASVTASATASAATPTSQPAGFLDRLAIYLMPYFLTMTPDRALAHSDIVETLQSCGARTRFELILAAKAMACDLSALDILAESKIMDMSASMRLRYAACAGGLGRLGRQTQQMLDRRLAAQPDAAIPAASPSPVASSADPALPTEPASLEPGLTELTPAEPLNDIADARAEETLQTMQADIQAYRNRLASAQPPAKPNINPPLHPNTNRPNANYPPHGNPLFNPATAPFVVDPLAPATLAVQAAAAQAAAKALAAHATRAVTQARTLPR